MPNPTEITSLSLTARQETLTLLDDLMEKTRSLELPKPPDRLGEARRQLADNTYDVVVVGEAKRGKSSFINALIGQDILPTDVEIATSQVFKVRRAAREAYRLLFEDGSQRQIPRDDLPRYGSEVLTDQGKAPRLDQIVRWIEVDIPCRFLPDGVCLVDTPGLGSLYAAHGEITYRFLPTADAVIFMLDSSQPILRSELDLLSTILEVTPDVFFIQTKIDILTSEEWQIVLRRNEEILRAELGHRLTDPRIWPVSSTNLRKAAQSPGNEETYLRVSQHRALAAALKSFLLRVAGWRRTAEAALLAEHCQSLGKRTLAERLAAVASESQEKRAETQKLLAERRRHFEAEWGEKGERRRELVETVDGIATAARQSILQELHLSGSIATERAEAIRDVCTLKEAEELGSSLSGQVTGAVMQVWQRIYQEAYSRCLQVLAPFENAADDVLAPEASASGLVLRDNVAIELEGLWWRKARGGYHEALQASGITGFAGTLVVAFFPPALPWAGLVILAAGLWGWMKGRRHTVEQELESAQRKLQAHLSDTLERIRGYMTSVNLTTGQLKSRVDEHLESLRRSVLDHIRDLVAERSCQAREELERLAAASRLQEDGRRERADQLREQLAAFEEMSQRLRKVHGQLTRMEAMFQAAAVAGVETTRQEVA